MMAAEDSNMSSILRRFGQRTYGADYLGLILLMVALVLVELFIEPFHRMFYLDDLAIQFPHADIERVPIGWLFAYAWAVPLAAIVLWALITLPGWHKAHVSILGLFISLILTAFITDIVKNAVGRPRPDLLARCKPRAGTPTHELVSIDVCEEKNPHLLQDGWRSFPSGHSSFAFAGLGYLAMVLAGQMHVLRPRTDLARVLLTIAPLLGALMIAISRCEDYRHDVYDVTIGSIVGLFIAHTTYRRYYPSLRSHKCHEPYLPMTDVSTKFREQDEEMGATSGGEDSDSERVPLRDRVRD